jgi:predicted metal-dependent phosphoesterase TrpH
MAFGYNHWSMEKAQDQWLRVDFHCHTMYSDDSLSKLSDLLKKAHQKKLDRLIITDHNTIQGAIEAKKLDPEFIIVGEEIETETGEILAAFVTEEVPAGLPFEEVVKRLRHQGAFISVSHPFDRNRSGLSDEQIIELAPLVDAIEIFNARCLSAKPNNLARQFAQEHHLPGTAGSDAHVVFEVANVCLRVPFFNTADELRRVISRGVPEGRLSPFWIHFFSTFATLSRKFRPGTSK